MNYAAPDSLEDANGTPRGFLTDWRTRARQLFQSLTGRHKKGLQGIGWNGLAQGIGMLTRLVSNLLLTRLLAPEVYGILGPALAIVMTIDWFSDIGIQPALIRNPEGMSPRYLLTAFWIGMGRAVLLSLLVAGIAWPWAQFNREPTLFPVLAVLGLRSIVAAFRSPRTPVLRRELNYRAVFFDEVLTNLIGTTATVLLAWWVPSLWSIVGGMFVSSFASVIISYIIAPMSLRWCWDRDVLRDISSLGRQIWINTVLMSIWLNLDRLTGLRILDKKDMGFFTVAVSLASVVDALLLRISDVYFSMLAQRMEDGDHRHWNFKVCRLHATFVMPAVAAGIVLAPWTIRLLFDPRYVPVGVLFGILTARAMVRGLGQFQYDYLLTTGDIRINTKAFLAALIVQIALMFPLARVYGVQGMAFSALFSTIAYTGCQTFLMHRRDEARLAPYFLSVIWAGLGLTVMYSFH